MSDHEVNLKILLSGAVTRGSLTEETRNRLLEACTDQVSEAVLSNNYTQSLAISLDERRARVGLGAFAEAIARMEREGVLDPVLEDLPNADELLARAGSGLHLTRPELSILLAHAKLHLKALLEGSRIPFDPALMDMLAEYFPPDAVAAVEASDLEEHRLRVHLVSTLLANLYVDRMGAASHIGLMGETDRAATSVAKSWFVANLISDANDLYSKIRAVDSKVRTGAQYQWYLEIAGALERATSWLLHRDVASGPMTEAVEALREPLARVRSALPDLLTTERLESFQARCALHEMDGLDEQTARELATFQYLDELLPIASLIADSGADPARVGASTSGWPRRSTFRGCAGGSTRSRGGGLGPARRPDPHRASRDGSPGHRGDHPGFCRRRPAGRRARALPTCPCRRPEPDSSRPLRDPDGSGPRTGLSPWWPSRPWRMHDWPPPDSRNEEGGAVAPPPPFLRPKARDQ